MHPDRWPLGKVVIAGLFPLALLALLTGVIVKTRPGDALGGGGIPPVERLVVGQPTLHPGEILLPVFNDGAAVTIAQVVVDDAYWAFSPSHGTHLKHLASTTLTIPYPWVEGEAHLIRVLTSTGTPFEREIPVALASPEAGVRYFLSFALIGLYVGVIPVALGLLWLPLASRAGPTGLDILLAITLGLLAFLLIDTVGEGLESAAALPASLQGVTVFAAAAAGAWLALEVIGAALRRRRAGARNAASPGAEMALLIAIGIGFHNFGEGLAIGAAFALGEATLGTLLIVGFTLHNTTEGLAIIAPIAREHPSIPTLIGLGAIGGVPTIGGAWLGGFVHSPVVAVLCLGLGAGAIAQVIYRIARQMAGDRPMMARFAAPPVALGLAAGFAVMYVTGMLVG